MTTTATAAVEDITVYEKLINQQSILYIVHCILLPFTRYDVWLVDWRVSCNLPSMVRRDYTLDDCAAYDYPAAINKVIEVTKQVYIAPYVYYDFSFKTIPLDSRTGYY